MSGVNNKHRATRRFGSKRQAPGCKHVSHHCVSSYRVAGPGLAMPCAIHELGGCAAGSNLALGWPRVAARDHCPTTDVNHRDAKICLRCINRFIAPVGRVDMADNYKLWTAAGRGLAFAGGSVRLSRFCLQARRYACICQRSGQIRHGGWFVSSPSSASSFSSSSYSSPPPPPTGPPPSPPPPTAVP